MFLSILIPTYNRSSFLIKNIKILKNIIYENSLENKVEIVISNNCSTDDTDEQIQTLISDLEYENIIRYFNQEENLGLENNALFTLRKSDSKYVMYLGDDDYIKEEYLIESLNWLKKDNKITTIIPSFQNIDIEGNIIQGGRDLDLKVQLYQKGFKNCLENSWRGHQLSGLIFKRENLIESYDKNEVQNIYLFIYFVAFNCIRGKTLHYTKYPIKVTQPGQNNKDWNYGDIGLIDEIFDNYAKLNKISYFQKVLLQLKLLKVQKWRHLHYLRNGALEYLKTIFNIIKSKNTLLLTKVILPLFILTLFMKSGFRKIIGLLRNEE